MTVNEYRRRASVPWKKTQVIKVCLTPHQYQVIKASALKRKETVSEYCRELLYNLSEAEINGWLD